MAKKKRVRRTKEQIELDNAKLEAMLDMEEEFIEVSSNVGDKVESFLEATGIAKAVKFLAGEDCGCDERKAKLNALFTYKVLCLNEEEYDYLDEFFKANHHTILPSQYREITKIASRILNKRVDASMGCGGCVRGIVKQMKQIYETY